MNATSPQASPSSTAPTPSAGPNHQGTAEEPGVVRELRERFPDVEIATQSTRDAVPTLWAPRERLHELVRYLREDAPKPYRMLFDLTAIDERTREHRVGPASDGAAHDFTAFYHLLSFDRNEDVRVKVALSGEKPSVPTVTDLWPSASWYEREAWDMFGIVFDGHPHLHRLLMPKTWKGHPLRKDHPARATEMGPFTLPDDKQDAEMEALQFHPEEWGLKRQSEDTEFLFLNIGPQHPGTHGVLRLVLQLDGEEIVDVVPEIGFHHRGSEKMAERQTWHSYIPYTDRVDYLGGVMNNLPYVLAVEKLAGIVPPERARVIRVMLCELFRISSHLVWYGTFAQDVGQMSPVLYMFNDREKLFEIIEAITGARMHPNWFRIGGVAQDLPRGWETLVRNFLAIMPKRLREYEKMILQNRLFKARTIGVGDYTVAEAIDWGVTGPGLRACGFEWDYRKARPYADYDQFEFDIPTATGGDCYARALVRNEELRQSLRIIQQCVDAMPSGPVKADHPLATPPPKEHTMHDIETLIHHFLGVSWGPVIPPGEAIGTVEATKGLNGYYLISDGGVHPYRARNRTPSFPHMQMVPKISKGFFVADLLAILGSIDFVLADIDR